MSRIHELFHSRWRGALIALGAVLLAACIALLCGKWGTSESQPTAQEKAGKLLADAHTQADAALAKRLQRVRAVFQRGRKGAHAFAQEALSWSGKWALIKGTLGIGEEDAHAAFLADAFAKHVFTSNDLKAALEGAVRGYLSDLDAIENQLLVRLRADLADSELSRGHRLSALASDDAFQQEYRRLAGAVTRPLQRDLAMEVGRQVAGFVAMDVATPVVINIVETVAAELGLEAGILGTGAASGVATLGIGLIVGIVIDQIIGFVLKAAGYDPEREIAAKVQESLNRIERPMLEGTSVRPGLRKELERIGQARSKTQYAVINKLLKKGGEQ